MMSYVSTEPFAIQASAGQGRQVMIDLGPLQLLGDLHTPRLVNGMVLVAYDGGRNRFEAQNRDMAETLSQAGFATCLFDLLTPEEEEASRSLSEPLDAGLLSERLVRVTDWLEQNLEGARPSMPQLPMGYLGINMGAAAALVAAADRPKLIQAVVSLGGRFSPMSRTVRRVQAPTLLLVGQLDEAELQANREVYDELPHPCKELVLIPSLVPEGDDRQAWLKAARFAAQWFERYLFRA